MSEKNPHPHGTHPETLKWQMMHNHPTLLFLQYLHYLYSMNLNKEWQNSKTHRINARMLHDDNYILNS